MPKKSIVIKNPEALKKKINKFKADGASNLHIISDFDRTLTKAFVYGIVGTPYEIIRKGNYFTPDYVKKSYAFYDKYRPIEISTTLSQEEKSKKMHEWWTLHYDLMVKSGMNMDVIKDIVKKVKMQLRQGASEFFSLIKKHKIPILIFSAGIGNVVKEYLKSQKMLNKNVHLVSNFFIFDKSGKTTGYLTPMIHTFNKNETPIKDAPFYDKIKHRRNVLLLGDILGDLGMSEGLEHDCIIRIGFLNEKVEESLDKFSKAFDAVILNDGPMDYVNSLIKDIL